MATVVAWQCAKCETKNEANVYGLHGYVLNCENCGARFEIAAVGTTPITKTFHVSDMIPQTIPDLDLTGICEVCKTAISDLGTHAMMMSGECPVTGNLLNEALFNTGVIDFPLPMNLLDKIAEYLNRRLIRRG